MGYSLLVNQEIKFIMDVLMESLRSGSVIAWVGLLVVAIIVIKLLFKFSKVLVLLCILFVTGYGLLALFPECAEFLTNLLSEETFDLAPIQ